MTAAWGRRISRYACYACVGMAAITLFTCCGGRPPLPTRTVNEGQVLKQIAGKLGVAASWEVVVGHLRCTFFALGRSRQDIEGAMAHFDFIFLRNKTGDPEAEYVIDDVTLLKHLGGELRVRYDDHQRVARVTILTMPPGRQESYIYEPVVCPARSN